MKLSSVVRVTSEVISLFESYYHYLTTNIMISKLGEERDYLQIKIWNTQQDHPHQVESSTTVTQVTTQWVENCRYLNFHQDRKISSPQQAVEPRTPVKPLKLTLHWDIALSQDNIATAFSYPIICHFPHSSSLGNPNPGWGYQNSDPEIIFQSRDLNSGIGFPSSHPNVNPVKDFPSTAK